MIVSESDDVSGSASTMNLIRYNSINHSCFIEIKFNSNYLDTATDLSIARTIAHETLHASLVFMLMEGLFIIEGNPDPDYKELMDAFTNYLVTNENDDYEGAQHNVLSELVGDIANSVANYGVQNNYSLPFNFYKDLAWGGLTHYLDSNNQPYLNPLFLQAVPNEADRTRIVNTIAAEATNTTQGSISPIGEPCE